MTDRGDSAATACARPARAARARVLEVGLVLYLGVLALAVRLPNYQLIPGFTDEADDLYRALLTAQGKLFPLTDTSSYIGSLWDWLAAIAFRASGYSLYAPRTLILTLGVLTVVASYPLGRAWGGRPGGILAAALLATSAEHIVVNSHVAWSNCVTPLFTALAVWTLHEAVLGTVFKPRTALLLSGLCWGLAFQTHPSALAMLPGAAIFLVWQGRPLLRTRWPCLAAGLFVLVNSNLLVYNLATGLESVSRGTQVAASYTSGAQLTPPAYRDRLVALLVGLVQDLGGAVDQPATAPRSLLDPGLWPIGLLAAAGVVQQWRRGNSLPALLLAGMVLIPPLFNGTYNVVVDGRFLAPLLPVLYAGVGALLATGLEGLERARQARPGASSGPAPGLLRSPGSHHRLAAGGLGMVTAFLLLHPLLYLPPYYERESKLGRTNAFVFRSVELLKADQRADEVVLIDQPLLDKKSGPGGGKVARAFRLALEANNLPSRTVDLDSPELLRTEARCREQFVILALRKPELTEEVIGRLDLRRIDPAPDDARSQAPLIAGLYRLGRLPGAPPSC